MSLRSSESDDIITKSTFHMDSQLFSLAILRHGSTGTMHCRHFSPSPAAIINVILRTTEDLVPSNVGYHVN